MGELMSIGISLPRKCPTLATMKPFAKMGHPDFRCEPAVRTVAEILHPEQIGGYVARTDCIIGKIPRLT